MARLSVVVPAYQVVDWLEESLASVLDQSFPDLEVIVVDDGSTDGTHQAVKDHHGDYPITVVRHHQNLGLGRTIDTGIRVALTDAEDDDRIVTIEADNTSDLDDMPKLLAREAEGYDIVVASVYAPGGRLLGVGWLRLLLSRVLSTAFRIVGGLSEVHTFTSVFRVYRVGPLRRAVETYGHLLVREPGYAASVELLLKLRNAGAKVAEVPTTNDWSQRRGTSKMRIRPTLLAYARLVMAHLVGAIQPPPGSPLAKDGEGFEGAEIELLTDASGGDSSQDRLRLIR